MDYDIVVIGAGPAGTMAAKAAAGKARVLLVDEKFISHVQAPCCAEGVGDAVLETLGIPEEKLWITNRVHNIMVVSPNGVKRTLKMKHLCALMLDRPLFEQSLMLQAIKAGARFESGRRVTNVKYEDKEVVLTLNDLDWIDGELCPTGGNEIITAKLVIDCSGVNGIATKAAGLHKPLKPNDIGVCSQYRNWTDEVDQDKIELWFGSAGFAPKGYTWIFPKGHYNNLGIGIQGGQGLNTDHLLHNFVFKRFTFSMCWDHTKSCLPLAPPLEVLTTKQCMAAGDAARFCIATTGAGIGTALYSGRLAGAIAANYLEGNVKLSQYDEVMHKTLIPKLKRAYRLKEKFCQSDDSMQRYLYALMPLLWLHKLIPKWTEKYAARNMRFA